MISEAVISRQCLCLFLNFSVKIEIESSQKVAAERHCILEYEKKRERKRERERERVCRNNVIETRRMRGTVVGNYFQN